MIQYKGRIIMEDVRLADGKGISEWRSAGRCSLCGGRRRNYHSLTAKLPFEETLNLKEIVNGR